MALAYAAAGRRISRTLKERNKPTQSRADVTSSATTPATRGGGTMDVISAA